MSSITTQQAKLDLELFPKEKRLEIGKCNGRLNPGKIQREPIFQVVLDSHALTPCYFVFLIIADVPEGQDFDALPTDEEIVSFLRELGHTGEINSLNDVVVDHQPWRTFAALINRSLSGKTIGLDKLRLSPEHKSFGIDNKAYKKQEKMYYPRFTKVIIHYFLTQDKTVSWRNKIRMHTSRDDYLIKTLIFVFAKEATQIYGAILPESLTSPEMKETKAYKTYLVSPEEPTRKSKRVKRHAKKSTKDPARGVVIKETPEMPWSKNKEKVDVTRGKGIELLFEVALTEDAQYEEGNDEDDSNNKQESSGEENDQENDSDDDKTQLDDENKSDSDHETDENESGLESDQEENEEDKDEEKEEKDEFVKTPPNNSDDEDETQITDKAEGDEDEEIDYTTSQLYDDGTDAELTNIQQGNENPEINQVIEDAHVTLSTIPQKTEVSVTSSSHLFDLPAKFLNFSDIPYTDAEIVSLIDVHVHHEVPSKQTPTLLTVPVSVIIDSSLVYSTVISQSLPSFTSPPQQSTSNPPPTTEATNPPSILPDFASVF
ncbi:hypothetical protein Tco_0952938 [Tanacetum coccineum]|uniref:Uncharacterized protein n=1 Tax=Tanacetum coccineum TaxID=301880 RepID=A0ABQ5E0A3_9ASTR